MAKAKKTEEGVELTKAQKIEALKAQLNKDYGKGTLIGGKDKAFNIEAISTGSIGLDLALGIGGLPKGRIVEVFGPESSGKTTLCLEVIKMAHKDPNSYCGYIDAEHALDTTYAEKLGCDLSRIEISQPDYGEQALEIADKMISSGVFDVVVVDSVAALVPKKELEGEMGDATMALQARMMSQACRKLTATIAKSKTVCIFINQLRDKIGVMFGNPETTTGGNALKFYSSVRIDIRRSVTADNSKMLGEEKVGNLVKIKVIKNKVAPPFKQCELDIYYNEGFDEFGELVKLACSTKIVEKSGQWYSYEGNIIAQGESKFRVLLQDNEELFNEIKQKVLDTYKPKEFIPTDDQKSEQQAEIKESTKEETDTIETPNVSENLAESY